MSEHKTKKNGLLILFNRFSGLVNDKAVNSLLSRMLQSVADIAVSFVNSVSSFTTYSMGLFSSAFGMAAQAALTLAGAAGATALLQEANNPDNRAENDKNEPKQEPDDLSTDQAAKDIGLDLTSEQAAAIDEAIENASDDVKDLAKDLKKNISGGSVSNTQEVFDFINDNATRETKLEIAEIASNFDINITEFKTALKLNEPPSFHGIEKAIFDENQDVVIVANWIDQDGNRFQTTHEFGKFDFEADPTSQTVTIKTKDSNQLEASQEITFDIINVNEAPTLETQIDFDGTNWTLRASASDPDANDVIDFDINGVDTNFITFNTSDIANDEPVVITITDQGGLTDTFETTVPALLDSPGNDAPIFISSDISAINEHETQTVTVTWFDPEDGTVETTHEIQAPDYDGGLREFSHEVSFTDSEGATVTKTLDFNINPVNEPPRLSGLVTFGSAPYGLGDLIFRASYFDPEGSFVSVIGTQDPRLGANHIFATVYEFSYENFHSGSNRISGGHFISDGVNTVGIDVTTFAIE